MFYTGPEKESQQMRQRAARYTTLDGLSSERDTIPWYWRIIAFGAAWLILGGFLTLPPSFETDPQLRVNSSFLAIFSVALLTAGFSLTGLLCFAVRNWLFRADAVFLPALASCVLGLLTVFYSFLISNRYIWNTPALLTTVASAVSSIVYGGLLFWTHRRIVGVQAGRPSSHIPIRATSLSSQSPAYQDPSYYTNYLANMYPSASRGNDVIASTPARIPDAALTEEELTRQQMLMLLLNNQERVPSPDANRAPSINTFNRIDWTDEITSPARGREPRPPPFNGYYAPVAVHPPPQSSTLPFPSTTAYSNGYSQLNAVPGLELSPPAPGYSEQDPNSAQNTLGQGSSLRPWDGIWRGGDVPSQERLHPAFRDARVIRRSDSREQRRREIEMQR